jgi:catechol 2,3-dioxygenase
MVPTKGLYHVHLMVADLDRSIRFYSEVFGMREIYRLAPAMVFLQTPGMQDVLAVEENPDFEESVGVVGGIAHLGFRLAPGADLDLAVSEVVEAGGKLLSRGEHDGGYPFAFVSDPDGNVIEL